MNFLTSWLLSVIGTALLVALAEALIPDTKVREAGRLVGGLILLVALLGPLIHLRGAGFFRFRAFGGDGAKRGGIP